MGDAKIGSESPVPGEAKKESTAIRSTWVTKSPGRVRPRWGPDSQGPSEAEVETRVPGSGRGPGNDQINRSKRPTWGPESPGMGEAQVATPTPGPGEASLQARVTRSNWGPSGDQSHQVNVSLQEHHSHQVQVWFMWERESPGPGETQVGTTVTRARLRPRWGTRVIRTI